MPDDFRDALRDPGAVSGTSLKELKPNVIIPAIPVPRPGSDRAAYIRDSEGEKDVFIGEVYADRKSAKKAMAAAVKGLETSGKRILFAALLKEKAGGDFYVVRLENSPAAPLRAAAVSGTKDTAYVTALQKTADDLENACRKNWQ
ncbi:MAG: hypothetical protein HY952_01910 [Elusimicrobia bacterium]|nr:hypothetical protein [Elusimicrobiota bacterium]